METSGLALIVLIMILISSSGLMTIAENKELQDNFMDNIRVNLKVIGFMWLVNFILFTTCLWVGEYAIHNGYEWMDTPLNTTLYSLAIAKCILTICLFTGMTNKNKVQ